LWKTGFSLDEGPVRDYQNPENKEFLEYIKRGYVGYYMSKKKFLFFSFLFS
jgi:UBX domain-containing protein 1